MSLLLDALKKAAEQKAAKNKSEGSESRPSDETLLDNGTEDITELMKSADDGSRQSRPAVRDETELDEAELETRVEQTRVESQDRTDTRLEGFDATETEIPSASAQIETGEDETIIFAEDDGADFTGASALAELEARTPDDETDLSQLAGREDNTDISQSFQARETLPPSDEDETQLRDPASGEDQTDISQPLHTRETLPQPVDEDETQLGDPVSTEDQTDIDQPFQAQETPRQPVAEDETELRDPGKTEDQTDISIPPASVADLEHAEAQRAAAAEDTDISQFVEPVEHGDDEDMSLLLVERDQTNLTMPSSATDTHRPEEQSEGLREDSSVDDELALVDTTRHRLPSEEALAEDDTQSSVTATTGFSQDTQTTRRSATTPTEATSTRTYAPDNYDRTLMRMPSDDASKIFAGMKSDSDVVMTPEYAKKVFDSKSSAQRLQHYKFYSGIAATILLGIFVYGLFEFQDQSSNIDDSLRALKRDPMPGVIASGREQQSASLFPESEVDERTIDIIENAESAVDDPVADAAVVAEETVSEVTDDAAFAQVEPEVESEAAIETEMVAEPDTELAMTETQADAPVTVTPRDTDAASSTEVVIATTTGTGAAATTASGSSSTLEISSSKQVAQKDTWLRQAYAAYQAGNDELALELYNKVLQQHPRNRNALLARAAIHVQNNNGNAAIKDYQAILLDNPKDALAMASLITVANYSPQESETQLKLMVREAPDSPYLNFALANAYSAQNRWQEAQGYYFRALQNNPGDPNYAYNLAVSLEHISQPRAAMSYYQRALENFDNGLATFSREVVDQRLEMLAKL
ncbi:MAG: tetratricopeptide repeat protein [Gammaproteobacteria bacterium]|jgi:tetratricopeptide (TPR) repeat protein|nr:tetratricopeptide repeat protein [Gammaproteobacteria bacterium]